MFYFFFILIKCILLKKTTTLRVRMGGLDKSFIATGTGSGRALCAVVVGYDAVVLMSIYSVELASIRSSTVVFVLFDDSSERTLT